MKKINFKSISLTNFLSFGKEVTISLKNGIFTIIGYNLDKADQNGVGKSAIVDGFYWILFGETLRELKKDEIVNDLAKKNCVGKLDFEIDKNGTITKYRIERGVVPSYCKIYINDAESKDKTLSTIPAMNAFIINLINSTPTVFRHTITMSINSTKPFMMLKKNEKREFIEGILRLELFKAMNKIAKENYDDIFKEYELTVKAHEENKNQIGMYNERKISFEKNRLEKQETLQKRKIDLETELAKLEKNFIKVDIEVYEKLVLYLSSLVSNIVKLESTLNILNQDIAAFNSKLNLNNVQITQKHEEMKRVKGLYDAYGNKYAMRKTLAENLALIDELSQEIQEQDRKIITLDIQITNTKNYIQSIKDYGSICEKCKRPFTDNDLKKNETDIKTAEELIKTSEQSKIELRNTVTNIKEHVIVIQLISKLLQLNEEIKQYNNDGILIEIKTKQDHYQTVQQELVNQKEDQKKAQTQKEELRILMERNRLTNTMMENHKTTITHCEGDLLRLQNERNEFNDLIQAAENKRIELEKKIEEYKEKVAIYNVIKFVVSDEGFKAYIIKKFIPILNERISYYMRKLDANGSLTFNEYFEDTCINDKKRTCSYEGFSAGERKRIDLALLFSFMDLRRIQGDVSFNIAFYDELLDSSISANCTTRVFDILKERQVKNESAYIITHRIENVKNPLIKDMITDTIYLEKMNGITRLGVYKP